MPGCEHKSEKNKVYLQPNKLLTKGLSFKISRRRAVGFVCLQFSIILYLK